MSVRASGRAAGDAAVMTGLLPRTRAGRSRPGGATPGPCSMRGPRTVRADRSGEAAPDAGMIERIIAGRTGGATGNGSVVGRRRPRTTAGRAGRPRDALRVEHGQAVRADAVRHPRRRRV